MADGRDKRLTINGKLESIGMKAHTTNYSNTFISVAEDCPTSSGLVPPKRSGKSTAAGLQHAMVHSQPYRYTSDDVVFAASAAGRALGSGASKAAQRKAQEEFFSKGQPCLRASGLGKTFGWGVHSDDKSRVAIYAVDSSIYQKLAADPTIKQVKAMRSKRA